MGCLYALGEGARRDKGGDVLRVATYSVLHLFSGIGGGALGFQQATEEWKGIRGEFETLAGIDNDPEACADFRALTGAPAHCMDLFSPEDYVAFHGQKPPNEWKEVLPGDLLKATNGRCPDVIFTSPPCKGFSGLLPSKSASSDKYQALNRLTVRGIFLALEAYKHDLPGLILLENVPRITSRGAKLLKLIKGMLESYGYFVSDGFHDCGEIGGLGQVRRRYLLIARQPDKVPAFVYKPRLQLLKNIGDVIGPLPLPDDPAGGPMHRLPRLKWRTWVRLAMIPAGGDWRDLQGLEMENYRLEHVPRQCAFGVLGWDKPGSTVTGHARIGGSTATAVADIRLKITNGHQCLYRVCRMDEPGPTVTGAGGPNNGAITIADDRAKFNHTYRVIPWDKESGSITGGCGPSNGGICVADPRLPERDSRHPSTYKVVPFDRPGPCVTGSRFGSGAPAISDPRPTGWRNGWKLTGAVGRVNDWGKPTDVVLGHSNARGNGASNVADPRINCNPRNGVYGVQDWNNTAKTVAGSADIHNAANAVADPRIPGDNDTLNPPPVIIALDGTWHRPLTTFELAMLQGFPSIMRDGTPFELSGNSQARWRERIGNAVPPPAARAVAETMLRALLPASEGAWVLGDTSIWVRRDFLWHPNTMANAHQKNLS